MNRKGVSSTVALAVLIVSTGLTFYLFDNARSLEQQSQALDFTNRARLRFDAVQEGIHEALSELESVNNFFNATTEVTPAQFETFTRSVLHDNPQILAFSFQRLVPHNQRLMFEAALHRKGFYDGIFVWDRGNKIPAPDKSFYRVVELIEPAGINHTSIGLDASSVKVQEDAVHRSLISKKPASTAIFSLGRDKTTAENLVGTRENRPFYSQRGFLILIPVYGQPGGDFVDDAPLTGYSAAVFRTGTMVQRIFTSHGFTDQDGLTVEVFGTLPDGQEELVYQNASVVGKPSNGIFYDAILSPVRVTLNHRFEVGGMPWHVRVSGTHTGPLDNRSQSSVLLVGGLALSVLLTTFAYLLTSVSVQIRRQVSDRTRELAVLNEQLIADIGERERILNALHIRTRAIEASANAVIITDADPLSCIVQYVNPAFERNTGYSLFEVVGRNCNFLQGEDRQQPGIDEIRAALREQRSCRVTLRNYRKDGTLFWNELHIEPVSDTSGVIRHFVASQYDITAVKRYEAELLAHANTDTLTGMPNRNLLRDRLSQAVQLAERYSHQAWLVFIDVDRFRLINDTMGQQVGNSVLIEIGSRLQSATRETDTVARFNGDKFAIILNKRGQFEPLVGIQRVLAAIRAPVQVAGQQIFLTASVGVAIGPRDGTDPDELVEHAEKAMYRAKERGGDKFEFYGPEMTHRALERLEIESDMRGALSSGEFSVHYQPKVDVLTGRIVGTEALIRWNHPTKGLVPPDKFIVIAEECGLIIPIGEWVLRTACHQTKQWQESGHPELGIAVNLSAKQFSQDNLSSLVATILAESGLESRFLELELTESMVMSDVARATHMLYELKSTGVRLAIDDFGTGYSSLAYLKKFPIDVLKIDKSFVRDISESRDDAAITLLVISLAHSLQLVAVAEGVETQAQYDFLAANGCDYIQGYFFSRPLVPSALEDALQRFNAPLEH